MTGIMRELYQYGEENKVREFLNQKRGYARACLEVEKGEEKLRTLVGEENREFLDELLEKQLRLSFVHEEAQFYAGFKTAMELFTGRA